MDMKRLAALALIMVGIALPVCAQRGGGHSGGGSHAGFAGGGFSGHSSGGFHAGFGGSVSSRAAVAPRYSGGPSSLANRSGFRSSGYRTAPYAYGQRSGGAIASSNHRGPERPFRPPYREPYRHSYGYGYGVGYGVGPVWVDPGYYGDSDDSGYDDGENPQGENYAGYPEGPSDGYDSQPPDEDQSQPPPPPYISYRRPYEAAPAPAAQPESAVTLVFKDGRAPIHIHNYILTRTTVSVLDQQRRDIPVAELDLPATEKANSDAGLSFELPEAAK